MAIPVSELQSIAPSAIIELFELQLNVTQHGVSDLYRFHAGANLDANGDLVWAGNTYQKFPLEADGFEYNGQGQLPRPKIRVANILGTITALLLTLPDGLEGAKVTRIRTLARYIDGANFPGGTNPLGTPDPTAEFPREIYYIDRKSAETRDVVEFELAAAFDLATVRAPKRVCIANLCQWKYRSTECSYTGADYYDSEDNAAASLALDVCGKRLSSCRARFDPILRSGTVTVGSNQLSLTSSVRVAAGTPITGFGVPASTTVSSISGLVVTMSQNATATTNVTRTGTIQSNRTQLVVSSASGLAVGMSVSGANIPAGTTISAISGTTLTLSQPAAILYTLFATRTGSLSGNRLTVSTTGLTVGMIVMGPQLPTNHSTTITGFYTYYLTKYATLSYTASQSTSSVSYSFYTTNTSYSSSSYSFAANSTQYVFRNPGAELPFGSFPGIGTFFA